MTRHLRIAVAPGIKVTGLLAGPGEGHIGMLLAPGAGAGQRSEFMAHMRGGLAAAAGVPVLTFDYPYREAGRSRPDPPRRLIEAHAAAAARLARRCDRVVLAGKSMGGRIGSHVVADGLAAAAGLVYYGYPLLPIGKAEPRSTAHLETIALPQLFWCGGRDRLGPPSLVRRVAAAVPAGRVREIPAADHSFRVPKSGPPWFEVLDGLVQGTVDFTAGL